MFVVLEVEIKDAGDRMKTARRRFHLGDGMTQEELANEIGLERRTVMKWETDANAPVPFDKILEIEEVLKMEIIPKDELLRAIAAYLGLEEVEGVVFRIRPVDG